MVTENRKFKLFFAREWNKKCQGDAGCKFCQNDIKRIWDIIDKWEGIKCEERK